jgi:hypothetical protein
MARRFYGGPEYYAGADPRRSQEAKDGSMLSADNSAIANMPQQVKYTLWQNPNDYPGYGLDDTIRGIDEQRGKDYRGMKKNLQPEKY